MRLINSSNLSFEEFFDPEVPPYAILSHTWSPGQEVSFQDYRRILRGKPSPARQSSGYAKIVETCKIAVEDHIPYVWVDTCCIDKSSSAELTESINSMFRWYKESKVCYVHLVDLGPHDSLGSTLAHCRWVTRGWTLQELLAPTLSTSSTIPGSIVVVGQSISKSYPPPPESTRTF